MVSPSPGDTRDRTWKAGRPRSAPGATHFSSPPRPGKSLLFGLVTQDQGSWALPEGLATAPSHACRQASVTWSHFLGQDLR